jgi:hypothetical protein
LVYVAAAADGDVVGEELEGDYFEDGEEEFVGRGDVDHVLDKRGDVLVAFDGGQAALDCVLELGRVAAFICSRIARKAWRARFTDSESGKWA